MPKQNNDIFDGHFSYPKNNKEHLVFRTPSRKNWKQIDKSINHEPGARAIGISKYFFATVSSSTDKDDVNNVKRWELRALKRDSGMRYKELAVEMKIDPKKLKRWLNPNKNDFDGLPFSREMMQYIGKKIINDNWFPGCPPEFREPK
jgi:hypothetical protein